MPFPASPDTTTVRPAADPSSLSFTAIDFETANRFIGSPCAVGLVRVRGGRVVAERGKRETAPEQPTAPAQAETPRRLVSIQSSARAMDWLTWAVSRSWCSAYATACSGNVRACSRARS